MALLRNIPVFGRTRALEREIDEFLDKLSECAIVFKLAVRIYLVEGTTTEFEDKLSTVNTLESRGDQLRRSIEMQLYAYTLIPDSRGDVLGLLENLDSLLNIMEGTLWNFSIETPTVPTELEGRFQELTEMVVEAVEALVLASRAFFRDVEAIKENMHKVLFYEKEADKISTQLKRGIFATKLHLSEKAHLRHFVEQIDNVADRAEDIADRLAIYAVKRRV